MKRRRPLRWMVASVLLGAAVVPVLIVMVLNYRATDALLQDNIIDELAALQDSRVQTITQGLVHRRDAVAILAADRSVVSALLEFRDAVDELDRTPNAVDEAMRAEVRGFYEGLASDPALAARLAAVDLALPPLADMLPDDAGTFLQYHYLVNGPVGAARAEVDDPGDGSAYSAIHARHHPILRERAADLGARDLLLVSFDRPRVVYTVGKGPDLAIDPIGGPLAESDLVAVLTEELPRATVGDAVLTDLRPYLGAGGEPLMFMAAAVLDGRQLIGAVVAQFPVDALSDLMTSGGRWFEVGLGETGETFVVGRDLRVRSDLRGWIEDPEAHLRSLRDRGLGETADAIAAAGRPVLIQEVDTAHVRAALDGSRFAGRSTDERGREVFATASPLEFAGLDWVVVAEANRSESTQDSIAQLRALMIMAAVLIPSVAVLGLVLARRLTRPVVPLLGAAEAVAAGRLEVDLHDPSRDEFGHLSRELRAYALALAEEEAELEAQHRAVDELLGSLLPPRGIAAVLRGTPDACDTVGSATVVTVALDGMPELVDAWSFDHAVALGARLERLAAEHGLERVWSSLDRHLFIAGLDGDEGRAGLDGDEGRAGLDGDESGAGLDGDESGACGAGNALAFAAAVMLAPERIDRTDESTLDLHVALAAGEVATGVVGGRQVSYRVTGRPVWLAMALESIGVPGQILVHESVLAHVDPAMIETMPGERASRTVEVYGTELVALSFDIATERLDSP